MTTLLALLVLTQARQEGTWYHTDAYSPTYLIRRQPWQAIAVDSKGRVYVTHPFAVGAGNQNVGGGRRIRVFDPAGEPLAELRDPNGLNLFGLAIDEANRRILAAANFQHVVVYGWDGPGAPIKLLQGPDRALAKKEGGRCVGVSLGKGGTIFTADLAENKVYRFYPAGGHSSFGSGPGGGRQGFNDLRRVFESPSDGSLLALDNDGVRRFSPIGAFLERLGPPAKDGGGILAVGPDGRALIGGEGDLELFDAKGKSIRKLPIPAATICDAALGADGRIHTIPRGEEFCYDAYDPDGKLLFRRGADFDRLSVSLPSKELKAGAPLNATVKISSGLQAGLLAPSERKAAEARPAPKVAVWLKPAAGGEWKELSGGVPAGLEGAHVLRFTTASSADGPGARAEFRVTLSR